MKNLKIFLVDDDSIFLKALENDLKNRNYLDIVTFQVGETCLDRLNEKPDVVIIDYFLDNKYSDAANGLELLKKVKKANPRINVIMLSGQDEIDLALLSMKLGAIDYIVKSKTAIERIDSRLKSINNSKEFKISKKLVITISVIIVLVLVVGLILKKLFFS